MNGISLYVIQVIITLNSPTYIEVSDCQDILACFHSLFSHL